MKPSYVYYVAKQDESELRILKLTLLVHYVVNQDETELHIQIKSDETAQLLHYIAL